MENKIEIHNMNLHYGDFHALHDINLDIKENEITAFIGPSGCGKSTLLRSLNRMNDLVENCRITGDIMLDGRDIYKNCDVNLLRRRVGMVFQKPTLFPWLTVEKNISFSLRMQNKFKGNEEEVERMLKVIGLEEFRDDYPGQLSGGMAQRVALVRSLINEPDILLLDEPLGALDAFTRMNMQDEILNMWADTRQLALMVTHDVDEAIYMGTRVLVMDANPGRIVAEIKIDGAFPRDRSSAQFVEYRNEILNQLHYGGKRG